MRSAAPDTTATPLWRLLAITPHLNGARYTLEGPYAEQVTGWMRGDLLTVTLKLNEQVDAANKRREAQLEWQDWAWSKTKEAQDAET